MYYSVHIIFLIFFPVKFLKNELFVNDACIFKAPLDTCSHICFQSSFIFIVSFDSLDFARKMASEISSSFTHGKTEIRSILPDHTPSVAKPGIYSRSFVSNSYLNTDVLLIE